MYTFDLAEVFYQFGNILVSTLFNFRKCLEKDDFFYDKNQKRPNFKIVYFLI